MLTGSRPLRPFLPRLILPNRPGRLALGHVRHSFAATLGTTDIPSIALARPVVLRKGKHHESIEPPASPSVVEL